MLTPSSRSSVIFVDTALALGPEAGESLAGAIRVGGCAGLRRASTYCCSAADGAKMRATANRVRADVKQVSSHSTRGIADQSYPDTLMLRKLLL